MTIEIRPAEERGHANHGWLDTWHTFSFADYHDVQYMSFSELRVINEDFVAPGHGFPPHNHRDMEILTYVLEGQLQHKDSLGNTSIIGPGEIQRMTAGTGVTHSEVNPSNKEKLHLLQIWIMPNQNDLPPSYEQKKIDEAQRKNALCLIASKVSTPNSVKINQDVKIYSCVLEKGNAIEYRLTQDRNAWIQVARGAIRLNGTKLDQGFGAGIMDENELMIAAESNAEFLLFNLPLV